jgi:hypothetical protein
MTTMKRDRHIEGGAVESAGGVRGEAVRPSAVPRRPGSVPGAVFRAVLAALALCAGSSVQAQTAIAPSTQEAIRLQQLAKRRYQELIRIMVETSRKLETTDPKTASAIAAASQKAEAALIDNEMDKVVQLLQAGMVIPADSSQAAIVLRLREVLKALKGEEGLEWRLFLIEELRQQLMALALIVERQRVLEIKSRMLAYGDELRARIGEARTRCDELVRLQEDVLSRTRNLVQVPASDELGGIRASFAAMIRRFEVSKDSLWKPTPSADELAKNVVTLRALFSETAMLRTNLRTLFNRDDMQRAASSPAAVAGVSNLMESVGNAAGELETGAGAMSAGKVDEAILAASQARAVLKDAIRQLDETVEAFPGVQPAVRVAADQKTVDDGASALLPSLRSFVPSGEAVADDSPEEDPRTAREVHHLQARQKVWRTQAPVTIALDPAGMARRQEQSVEKLRDYSDRFANALRDVDRIRDDPRYPAQKKGQEGIVADLRSILDANKSQSETIGDDKEMIQVFSTLRTGVENAADYAAKAVDHLGREMPKEANTNQNDVINFLVKVMSAVGPELQMDANKYAMNEQAQARIQRMIMKQKMCLAETKDVWKRRGQDGSYSRPDRLRVEGIARDEKSIEDDADACWEIMNTKHNMAYNTFPAEARLMMEMVRLDVRVAVRRLSSIDAGLETQDLEQRILDRLKETEKMVAQQNPNQSKEADRSFTYDSFVSRGPINFQNRVPIILMYVALQDDINRRTAAIEKQRLAGAGGDELDREAEMLRQLQENIRIGMEEYAILDAGVWRKNDTVGPRQY